MDSTDQTEHGVCPLPASWEPPRAYSCFASGEDASAMDQRPSVERMTVGREEDWGEPLTPRGVSRAVWRGRAVAVWNLVRSDTGWYLAWAMLVVASGWLVLTAWTVWGMGNTGGGR